MGERPVVILDIVTSLVAIGIALVRPGAGIGMALALGRHELPNRSTPLIAAAPVLCLAAAIGLLRSGRRLRVAASNCRRRRHNSVRGSCRRVPREC